MKSYDVKPLSEMHLEIGLMAAMLGDGTREWREELSVLPIDAIMFQPFKNGHSIGALILHMIEVEDYWIEQFMFGRPENEEIAAILKGSEIDQDAVKWPTPPAKPIEWYYDLQDRIRQRTLLSLKECVEPEKICLREKQGYQVTQRWVLNHVVNHEAYHGGQVVLCDLMYRSQHEKT